MRGSDKRFDAKGKRIVSEKHEPELFKLASDALTDRAANGMFVYGDRLWMVAAPAEQGRITIWPELP